VLAVHEDSYTTLHIHDHVNPNWIASYVVQGSVTTSSLNQTELAEAGDVMIHPPYLPFAEYAEQPGVHQWMAFSIVGQYQMNLFERSPVGFVVHLERPEQYRATFQSLLSRWNSHSSSFREVGIAADTLSLTTMIMESFELQAHSTEQAVVARSPNSRFAVLIRYMQLHLNRKLSRDELAEQVHLNPNYLDRIFHEFHGLTPMQMLRDMRLQEARRLLGYNDSPLSSIAQQCGMGDSAYLHRQFVKAFQMTPGQYRDYLRNAGMNYLKVKS
jgi:AraC-like DNA-binding protein